MKASVVAVVAAVLVAGASPVAAQDRSLAPTFGAGTLAPGFGYGEVDLVAGGPIDVQATLGGPCVGFVGEAPDYRVQLAGGGAELTITADSPADATLVISDPSGEWHCDDDSGADLSPAVTFAAPLSGQYDIWVGTYGRAAAEATLMVIEGIEPVRTPDG